MIAIVGEPEAEGVLVEKRLCEFNADDVASSEAIDETVCVLDLMEEAEALALMLGLPDMTVEREGERVADALASPETEAMGLRETDVLPDDVAVTQELRVPADERETVDEKLGEPDAERVTRSGVPLPELDAVTVRETNAEEVIVTALVEVNDTSADFDGEGSAVDVRVAARPVSVDDGLPLSRADEDVERDSEGRGVADADDDTVFDGAAVTESVADSEDLGVTVIVRSDVNEPDGLPVDVRLTTVL